MIKQREALLRLLRDDDPVTLALVKEQMASKGAASLPDLQELMAVADAAPARQLREIIAQIEGQDAEAHFGRLCGRFGEHGNLEDAAWKLAAAFLPGEDFSASRGLLDEWGAEVARRLKKAASKVDRVETLVEFLGDEVRLQGNEEDYYNLNNSLLSEVIELRVGIPISLSLVYMLVGKRSGLELRGVALPGHFIVRHEQHFFDPFAGGKRLSFEECRSWFEQQRLVLTPQHLKPVTSRQMLLRMLSNIHHLAAASDPPLASKVYGWVEALRSPAPRAV